MRSIAVWGTILLSVLFLSACGGGGGGGSAAGTTPSTTTTPATSSKYVNVDFTTKVQENDIYLSDLNEFVNLCNNNN